MIWAGVTLMLFSLLCEGPGGAWIWMAGAALIGVGAGRRTV